MSADEEGRTDVLRLDGWVRRTAAAFVLALVTRDLILAFPVTYLAKTRLNLL